MPGACGATSGCLLDYGGGLELPWTGETPGLEPGEEEGPRGPWRGGGGMPRCLESAGSCGGTWPRARGVGVPVWGWLRVCGVASVSPWEEEECPLT